MMSLNRVVSSDASGMIEAEITPRHQDIESLLTIANGGEGEMATASDTGEVVVFRGTPTDQHTRLSPGFGNVYYAPESYTGFLSGTWVEFAKTWFVEDPLGILQRPGSVEISKPPFIDRTKPSLIRLHVSGRLLYAHASLTKIECRLQSGGANSLHTPSNKTVNIPLPPDGIEFTPMTIDFFVAANQWPIDDVDDEQFMLIQFKPTGQAVYMNMALTMEFHQ